MMVLFWLTAVSRHPSGTQGALRRAWALRAGAGVRGFALGNVSALSFDGIFVDRYEVFDSQQTLRRIASTRILRACRWRNHGDKPGSGYGD